VVDVLKEMQQDGAVYCADAEEGKRQGSDDKRQTSRRQTKGKQATTDTVLAVDVVG
jgi:hypothetical protein